VRGQASVDVSDITDAILEDIKTSEVFKDLIEDAVASSDKLAELSDAIKENADGWRLRLARISRQRKPLSATRWPLLMSLSVRRHSREPTLPPSSSSGK
jgi:hypothetical protein